MKTNRNNGALVILCGILVMAALFAATKLMAAGNCYMVTLTLTQGYSGEIWTVMADGRGSSQTMTNNVEMVVNDGQSVVVTHNNGCVQPADYLQPDLTMKSYVWDSTSQTNHWKLVAVSSVRMGANCIKDDELVHIAGTCSPLSVTASLENIGLDCPCNLPTPKYQ